MDKFCSACGTALEEGTQFCAKCGKPVNGAEAAPGQTGAGFAWPTGERLKVLLLAIFLGIFGGHCFYTGRKGRGLIELLLGTGGPALMIIYPLILRYGNMSASDLYDGFTYNLASPIYAPIFAAALASIVFFVLWVMDVFKIFRGRFNKVESAVTTKHLVFLGVLLGLRIVMSIPGLGRPVSFLRFLLTPAINLCGVFFGPLPGTIIAALFAVIGSASLVFQGLFNIFFVLRSCIITAVTALIVYGCLKLRSPEGRPDRKLPDFAGKPVLQGILIGIAYLAALLVGLLAGMPFRVVFRMPFYDAIIYAAVAGLIGAALPPLLAKKGLYLGPFVTPGQTEVKKTNGDAEATGAS
jgi:TM2 domain-containing membrane protein YozV